MKVADEAWLAACILMRQRQAWDGVPVADIVRQASREFYGGGKPRQGVYVHAVQHAVANKPKNTVTGYRMLTANGDLRRPFVAGDVCMAGRDGKMVPRKEDIPPAYHEVVDWYENQYAPMRKSGKANKPAKVESPILIATKSSVKALGTEPTLLAISHEVLRLKAVQAGPKMLLLDGLAEEGRAWLAKHGALAPDIQLLELLADGSTRPLE